MSTPCPIPFYFGSSEKPLFGWLHRPRVVTPGVAGLVLCSPFGYDAVSAHRSYRYIAEAAANAGIPALRFDFYSTGDSSGNDTDAGLLSTWIASVGHAVQALRAQTAVSQVCLFGMRLAAVVALLAAQELPEVTVLIALSPIVSGRRYLRELTALAAASPIARVADAASWDGMYESAGFAMTDATRSDIMALGLSSLSGTSIRQALLIDRGDLPADDTLATHLSAQGVQVTRLPFMGYSDMMLDAHETVVPQDMLLAAVSWLRGQASSASAGACQPPVAPTLATSITVIHEGAQIRETATFLDADRRLFGIVSKPGAGPSPASTKAQILLLANAGAVLHTGPNRLYVSIARSLAALSGMTVIRFDLTGLGDSPPRPGEPDNVVYGRHALADMAAARDFAANLEPAAELHLAGICSGAYHSLKSALGGAELGSIVVINPLTFFWKEGMSLAQSDFHTIAEAQRYRQTSLQLASWLKLLRGQVDLLAALRVLYNRVKARIRSRLRSFAAFLRIPLQDDLSLELRQIAARNTQSLYIFAATDPGLSLLHEQGGDAVRKLQRRGRIQIEIIEAADHTLTPRHSQHELLRLLMKHFAQLQSSCVK